MAAPASSTRPGKLMMIGWPTPTVEPFFGTNEGGPNGAAPVNGVGFCPAAGPEKAGTTPGAGGGGGAASGGGAGGSAGGATTPGSPGAPGSGSASAGTALNTSAPPNTEAAP